MARDKKPKESDEMPGAPEWMVTFSDCMTLLLTFFVLLLTFSSFDDRIFRNLKAVYSRAFTNITVARRSDREAVVDMPPVRYIVELDKGSEKPTETRGEQENLMKNIEIINPRQGIAFVISSKRLFWGKGTAISSEGGSIMDLLGSFLEKVPSRFVISETGASQEGQTPVPLPAKAQRGRQVPFYRKDDDKKEPVPTPQEGASPYFGLPRAWAVMDYLTTKTGLGRERFSISQSSSLPHGSSRAGSDESRNERKVEIVLLERSIYD